MFGESKTRNSLMSYLSQLGIEVVPEGLSTSGEILAEILLKRLRSIAEVISTGSQCGFRRSRSTIDMIFTLRQLQEKAVEQQQSLYMIFIDMSKVFDAVDRSTLLILLKRYGCPETVVNIIQKCHEADQLLIHLKLAMD